MLGSGRAVRVALLGPLGRGGLARMRRKYLAKRRRELEDAPVHGILSPATSQEDKEG
jgi:hypothetical protein